MTTKKTSVLGRYTQNPVSFDLEGKIACITGSSRGIGEAIAWGLAHQGAKVVISSRKKDSCEETAQRINHRYPRRAIGVACNTGKNEDMTLLFDTVMNHWGHIDILVCNAGFNAYHGPFHKASIELVEKTFQYNVFGSWFLCQKVLPQMQECLNGVILFISSMAGLRGSSHLSLYSASKATQCQMARSIAAEYGPFNIRANSIAPGIIKTEMSRNLWENPQTFENYKKRILLDRIGTPEEIAGLAVLLASPAGCYINGQNILVDGGFMVS